MRRFQAYESYLSASEEAKVLEREDGIVVSVPSVENHPIYELFRKLIDLETTRASNRARARNGMRRFVLDVHTVWITNLAHLRKLNCLLCCAVLCYNMFFVLTDLPSSRHQPKSKPQQENTQ